MIVLCSLAVQSSRSLLSLGCFSSFGLGCSLWSVRLMCLQILERTLLLQSFVKWPTLRQLRHILLLRTNLLFLVEWQSLKSFIFVYEVILLAKVALHLPWSLDIWIIEFGNFVTLLDLEMSCLWCACRCCQCTGFHMFLNFLWTCFRLYAIRASSATNSINALKLGYGIPLSKALVKYLFQCSVVHLGSFFLQFLIFLAIIQHLQTGYVWYCTVASYKEIIEVSKFDSRPAVELFSEYCLDHKVVTITLM